MAWQTSKPAGSDAIQDSDDNIRDNWTAIETGLVPYDYLRLEVQGSAPTEIADHGLLYAFDVNAKAELHYEDEDSNDVQLTSGGKIGNANVTLDSAGAIVCTSITNSGAMSCTTITGTGLAIVQKLHVNAGASGDSEIIFDINGTDEFYMGVDDDDSDKFKLGVGGTMGTTAAFEIDSNADMYIERSNLRLNSAGANDDVAVQFRSFAASAYKSITWDDAGTVGWKFTEANLFSSTDNSSDLGTSGLRWDDVYATNGTIQTSDRRDKKDIVSTSLGLDFIKQLNPVEYKWKDGNRCHQGMIAQDVEKALNGKDFAGLIKGQKLDQNGQLKELDFKNEETYRTGLRYAEFIAPLIKAVQELSKQVEELKQAR